MQEQKKNKELLKWNAIDYEERKSANFCPPPQSRLVIIIITRYVIIEMNTCLFKNKQNWFASSDMFFFLIYQSFSLFLIAALWRAYRFRVITDDGRQFSKEVVKRKETEKSRCIVLYKLVFKKREKTNVTSHFFFPKRQRCVCIQL